MSVGSNVVKLTAKTALKGNYLKVAVASMILVFTWLICINSAGLLSFVAGKTFSVILSFVLLAFLVLPISLGVLRYVWRILNDVSDNPISVFYWFSEKGLYIKVIKFIVQFLLRIVFWFAVLNVPSFILFALSKSFLFEFFGTAPPLWTANLEYYSILLRNISFVLVFFIMLKFYLAPMLLVVDENIDISEAMYTSSVISRKSSIDFIGLIFTSLGWLFLSLFVLPLPFTLPLLFGFYTVHSRFAIAEYNRLIEASRFSETEFI